MKVEKTSQDWHWPQSLSETGERSSSETERVHGATVNSWKVCLKVPQGREFTGLLLAEGWQTESRQAPYRL